LLTGPTSGWLKELESLQGATHKNRMRGKKEEMRRFLVEKLPAKRLVTRI